MNDLRLKIFKKIKQTADRILFPRQDRLSTYIYYMAHQVANRRFMSMAEYMYITKIWARTIPRKFDLVIGIPRNGMIPAELVGIEHGVPVANVDTFINKTFRIHSTGTRKDKYENILLVDENVGTGRQMQAAKERLLKIDPKLKISTAAPFVTEAQAKNINYYYAINKGTILATELDLIKTPLTVGCLCTDMDGVLCEDMPIDIKEEDKESFIKNAKPNIIPRYAIETIATGRPEAYRSITEEWLKKNNVIYNKLVMAQADEDGITTKVKVIRKDKPGTFWESDPFQSRMIFLRTGCRVLCTENMYFYGGNQYDYIKSVS